MNAIGFLCKRPELWQDAEMASGHILDEEVTVCTLLKFTF